MEHDHPDTLRRLIAIVDSLARLYAQGLDENTSTELRELKRRLDEAQERIDRTQ